MPAKSAKTHILFFNLLLIFWLLITGIVLVFSQNVHYLHYLLSSATILAMAWSYNLGLLSGLILSLLIVFAYGSYLMYGVLVSGGIAQVKGELLFWLFTVPLGALLTGQLRQNIDLLEARLQEYASLLQSNWFDHLTGLLNERGFFSRLEEEAARAKRFQTPLSALLLLLRNSEELKALYGQKGLERIIKALADKVEQNLRHIDNKARLDESSLAIILPGTPLSGAMTCADKLAKLLEKVTVEINGTKKVIRPGIFIARAELDLSTNEDALLFWQRLKEEAFLS